jgi:S1-C subfamily serine protease
MGFPKYHNGDDVSIKQCEIVQQKVIHGITHFVIEPSIIVGNSGGPVLNGMNQVVGVAVKGQGEMGEFTSSDEVSCFLPIEAVKRLKN